MSVLSWWADRSGGLSIILLLSLCLFVFFEEIPDRNNQFFQHNTTQQRREAVHISREGSTDFWKQVFAYYSLLIHILVIIFPIRACRAIWELTGKFQQVTSTPLKEKLPLRWKRSSISSLSSIDSSAAPLSNSSSQFSDYWESSTESEDEFDGVIHAILVPNYKEDVGVLRETLDVLASHPQARYSYHIYLAMEQRELGAHNKAAQLIDKFGNNFRYITATFHPSCIPGESAGKSSNLSWAARVASQDLVVERGDVIITSIDADSHLSWRYFSEITAMHLSFPNTAATTLYAAPIIFDRNAHQVPGIVRVADVLWCAAGLSGQYQGSTICPPTSVYSVPLQLVDRVGGWDAGPDAIGEDLHMYLKCFFTLNGHLTTRIVTSPVSQTNVTGSGDLGFSGYIGSINARYRQALRHMWGSLDSGYALRRFGEIWRRQQLSSAICRSFHLPSHSSDNISGSEELVEESSKRQTEDGDLSQIIHMAVKPPNWLNLILLLHRLFEAHFLPTHMSILVIASSIYRSFIAKNSGGIAWTFVVTDILRAIGLLAMLVYFISYQKYHHLCIETRQRDMDAAGLTHSMSGSFSRRSWKNALDCIWIPFVAPLYGSIPAIHAQISHFWTVDLVYVVSNKPLKENKR